MNQHDIKLFTHRPTIAQYEQLTRPGTSSIFSRNYRKTQLLRKLDVKLKLSKASPLVQEIATNKFMCMAKQTPIHDGREKLLNEKGRKLKQRHTSCQTDLFPSMNNLVFMGSNIFQSYRQFEHFETQMSSNRKRTLSNNLKRSIIKTQPSFSKRGSVERFKLPGCESDPDFMEYITRETLSKNKYNQ